MDIELSGQISTEAKRSNCAKFAHMADRCLKKSDLYRNVIS